MNNQTRSSRLLFLALALLSLSWAAPARAQDCQRIGILKTLSECGTLLERGETLPLQN